MAIRFFYLPRGRKYNYKPRFYDERKEELEKRKRKIDRELGLEEDQTNKDGYVPHIKGEMRRHMKIANKKRKRTSTTLMLVVLAFLIFISYLLLRL